MNLRNKRSRDTTLNATSRKKIVKNVDAAEDLAAKTLDSDSSLDSITILSVTKNQVSNEGEVLFLEERRASSTIPRSRSTEVDEVILIEERIQEIIPSPHRNISSAHHEMDEAMARNLQEQEYRQVQAPSFSSQVAAMRAAGIDEATIRTLLIDDDQSGVHHRANYVTEDGFDDSYEGLLALGERLGSVKPKGLPKHLISRLSIKRFIVPESKKVTLQEDDRKCVICMSDYESNDKLTGLPCCHYFHAKCAERWLEESHYCPICRCDIQENVE